MVRGLGPRVPLRRPVARGRAVRQGPARPDAARVVHAPERPDPGLRVELRRREPARARLGGAARLPDRKGEDGQGRPGVPRARLPQAAPELRLVGQPQGRARQQHLPGRLPRARQHRHLRPQHEDARGMGAQPGRRHELDGDVLPEPARHGARARERGPGLRGRRVQVLGALRLHRPRHPAPGRSGARTLGRAGRLLLRRDPPRRRPPDPHPRPFPRRPAAPDRRRHGRFAPHQPVSGFQAAHGVVLRAPAGPDLGVRLDDPARRARADPDVGRAARAAQTGPGLHARRIRVPLPLRHPLGVPVPPRPPVCRERAGPVLPPPVRARASRAPTSSGATRTGGDPSGFRSTT